MENNDNQEVEIEVESTALKTQKPKFKQKRYIFPVIFGIALAIFGINYYNYASTYVSTDDAYVEGHNVQISPKIAGNIVKVYIDDNQKVKKGDLLAEIDPQDYQVKYDQAIAKLEQAIEKQKNATVDVNLTNITSTAALDQANSAVGASKSTITMTDKQVAQAKANLEEANQDIESSRAELNNAQVDYNRYQKLHKKGAVSKQDYDKVSTNYKTLSAKYNSNLQKASYAQSAIESAYANKEVSIKNLSQALGKLKGVNTVPEQLSVSKSNRKIAIAEIKQLQAAAKQARLELSYTKIYAPQSGRVTNKSVETGAYVQTGQSLLSIVPEKRWVVANFKETQLTNMKIGQNVDIKVDAYPNKSFKGRVDSVQSSTGSKSSLFPPENAVGSFVKVVQRIPVKITFTEKIDPKYAIVPGMSVIPDVKIK